MIARNGALLLTALSLTAVVPIAGYAQDAGVQRDTRQTHTDAAQVQREAAREGRESDRLNNDPNLNNDQSPRRDDGHGADEHITNLHRTHPHAAARCHDGFFTTTRDRGRACTRHGGVEVWLSG